MAQYYCVIVFAAGLAQDLQPVCILINYLAVLDPQHHICVISDLG